MHIIEFRTRTVSVLLPLIAAFVLADCASMQQPGTSEPRQVSAGEGGMVAGIQLVTDIAQASGGKVLVASYRFAPDTVQPREAIMAFGATNIPRTEVRDFMFQVLGPQDRVLAEFGIMDPRKVVVEQQGLVLQPEALYAARFPFHPAAQAIRVLDNRGTELARTNVVPVIRAFCERLRQDRDCAAAMRASQP